MIRKLYLLKLLLVIAACAFNHNPAYATAFYVQNMNPWGQTNNQTAMTNVFGAANVGWYQASYATPATTVFSPTTHFVMLEGSDGNSSLPTYLATNQATIENWVAAGGHLFINAAPNYGASQNWGFDNTVLNYPNYVTTVNTSVPSNPIFTGPYLPTAASFSGINFGHGYFTGNNLYTLLYDSAYAANARPVLSYKPWGNGIVMFGSCTQPLYWNPTPQSYNVWSNIFSYVNGNAAIVQLAAVNSFSVYGSSDCTGLHLETHTNSYAPGMSIKTFFGDNTSDSSAVNAAIPTGGTVPVDHIYELSGTYTLKQFLYSGASLLDSVQFSYTYQVCNSLFLSFYADMNNNCLKDSTEWLAMQASLTEVDSNNVPVDTISTTSGFYYTAYGNPGDVYKFKIISLTGYLPGCPANGELYDTLVAGSNNKSLQFGLNCITGNDFDLSLSTVTISGRHSSFSTINLNNAYCAGQNAVLTMHYSPKYTFDYGSQPNTNTGQTLTWNISNLNNSGTQQIHATLKNAGPGWLTAGDTVNYTFNITPTTGDADISNNAIIIYDTVTGAWDPNHISVTPSDPITAGTKLKYSIQFENVGNDTAFNIYVLDTLPAELDMSTLRIASASNTMYVTPVNGAQNIIKFEFPNINLPDSVHFPDNCTGMFTYTINTKTGLPAGTPINSRVGIYFDYNDVVMTNTAISIIGTPTGIATVNGPNVVKLFPNPATDELTIKTSNKDYTSLTITNNLGQVVLKQDINSTQTKVNVKQLPAGMYYVNLKGVNGSDVRKFVKM